jgi:hypothetical protein
LLCVEPGSQVIGKETDVGLMKGEKMIYSYVPAGAENLPMGPGF